MIVFTCELCGVEMEAPQSEAGKVEKCPKCKTLNRVPTATRPAKPGPDALADMGESPREEATPKQASASQQTRSMASFLWGWGFIVGAIIAWLVSYAVLSQTQAEVDLARSQFKSAWDKKCAPMKAAIDKHIRNPHAPSEELESLMAALSRDSIVSHREEEKKVSEIKETGALIALAVRIGAGVCALAGVIMVSYWLGTGGMRPRGGGHCRT